MIEYFITEYHLHAALERTLVSVALWPEAAAGVNPTESVLV